MENGQTMKEKGWSEKVKDFKEIGKIQREWSKARRYEIPAGKM